MEQHMHHMQQQMFSPFSMMGMGGMGMGMGGMGMGMGMPFGGLLEGFWGLLNGCVTIDTLNCFFHLEPSFCCNHFIIPNLVY